MERTESGTENMTLVRLRERAQITLPQEVRDALRVKQGDYLEAEVVEGGVRSALAARGYDRSRRRPGAPERNVERPEPLDRPGAGAERRRADAGDRQRY